MELANSTLLTNRYRVNWWGLGLGVLLFLELGVKHMSKDFWQGHSIKGQKPDIGVDGLINQLKAGRVNVSNMTEDQLNTHMEDEAGLRRRIRLARGLPEILPTQEVIAAELANEKVTDVPDVNTRQYADATQVRVRGR